MIPRKEKVLKLRCPNCGKVFFRTEDLAHTVMRCPACHTLCTFNKEGKCASIKQIKYKHEKKKLAVVGGVATAAGARALWRRRQLKPISKIAKEVQKAVGIRKPKKVKPIGPLAGLVAAGWAGGKAIRIRTPGELRRRQRFLPRVLTVRQPGRRILAHEIAHLTPAAKRSVAEVIEATTRAIKPGTGLVQTLRDAGFGKVIAEIHGPTFKSSWRHVEKVMKRLGTMKRLRKLGYAREDPKHVRTYFNELKQHKVAFRTRMQWLSRIYGGRGGYTSEELYKIVTGKTVSGYYIFPFVKGAPPEVNRILERTYRTHREAGDTKTAAAIAAWANVKKAGYVKVTKPAPVWTKRRYNMEQLKPMKAVDYGLGTGIGKLADRSVRDLFGATRRHPRIARGTGIFGVGYLTAKALEKRRKRKKGYALDVSHFTPDIPAAFDPRVVLKSQVTKWRGAGKLAGRTATRAVKAALIGLAAKEILDLLSKRRSRAPWMPAIRADVELAGYETLDQVVEYASVMPTKMLKMIQTKTTSVLHKTKVGVERGLLAWLLGFVSAELLSRGITTPKRRHTVVFPKETEGYRLRISETGEQLPRRGFQPFTPTKPRPMVLPKFKRHRMRKIGKVAPALILPIGAFLALQSLKMRKQQGYSFRSATGKLVRSVKKTGAVTGKVLGKVYPAAMTALIVSEMWPRKKQRLTHPPVLSRPIQPYKLKGLKRLLQLRKAKPPTVVGQKLRDLTLSRKDPALAELNKRLAAAAQKHKKHFQLVEMYPLKSQAQRRWMHMKKPKMAKEWEEHTPKGKKLPEHVSKHAMRASVGRVGRVGRGSIIPVARETMRRKMSRQAMLKGGIVLGAGLAGTALGHMIDRRRRQARKRMQAERVSKHALSVPLLWRHIRSARQLHKSRLLGKDITRWGGEMAARMRKLAAATLGQKITVKGVSTPAPAWFGKEAAKWDAVANQAKDMVLKGQLEKVGLLAAGVAAGAAGHEVGRKQERKRVRKLVG